MQKMTNFLKYVQTNIYEYFFLQLDQHNYEIKVKIHQKESIKCVHWEEEHTKEQSKLFQIKLNWTIQITSKLPGPDVKLTSTYFGKLPETLQPLVSQLPL